MRRPPVEPSETRAKAARPEMTGLVILSVVLVGCSQAVQMVRDDPSGGIVAYSFKEDRGGPVMSRYRKEAFARIERKCPTGFRILREGETRGYTSMLGTFEGTEDERIGRKWGIQFECK